MIASEREGGGRFKSYEFAIPPVNRTKLGFPIRWLVQHLILYAHKYEQSRELQDLYATIRTASPTPGTNFPKTCSDRQFRRHGK
jgi:hypothetical protein